MAKKRKRKRPHGTGSIVKLKGSRAKPYEARAPKTQQTIGTYKTYNEANEALEEYNKSNLDLSNPTLDEVIERMLDEKLAAKELEKATLESMNSAYKAFGELKKKKVRDITRQDIINWRDKLAESLSNSSVNLYMLRLNEVLEYAYKVELIRRNYCKSVSRLKEEKKEVVTFPRELVIRIYKNYPEIPELAVPIVMLSTGFRIDELRTCKVEYIDFKKRFIQHGGKTEKGKHRKIFIIDQLLPVLEDLCGEGKNYLFQRRDGNMYSRQCEIRKAYNKGLEAIGVDVKKYHPHTCRKTFASMASKAEVRDTVMTDLLGHENIKTTIDHYIKNDEETIAKETKKVSAYLDEILGEK